MAKATTLIQPVRDLILVDETRHPLWLAAASKLAQQRGSSNSVPILVRDPTPHWFDQNQWAIPDAALLQTFRSSGIVFLPEWDQLRDLRFGMDKFAQIAVASCLSEVVKLHAGRTITLVQLGGSTKDLIEQRRIASRALQELDDLDAGERAERFESAFLNDTDTAPMHLRFDDLRTNYRADWLDQLDSAWQSQRTALARMTSIDHLSP